MIQGIRDKFRAAGVHLALSGLVAALAATVMFGVLYPYPYRDIAGGRSLFELLVGVDVVVGPLLTWLVFNRRKPASELRRDLAFIALIQLAALGYGLWSMYQARPVYLVHEVDRFVVVTAADVDPVDLNEAAEPYRKLPLWGIQTLGLRDPKDPEEKLKSIGLALKGKDLSLQPQFWQALSPANREVILKRAKPLDDLRIRGGDAAHRVDAWLSRQPSQTVGLRYFPLVARNHYWTVVLDGQLNMIGYLPIDPF